MVVQVHDVLPERDKVRPFLLVFFIDFNLKHYKHLLLSRSPHHTTPLHPITA
jgi:hypothetical protein